MMRSRISRAAALVLAALCVAAQPAPAAELTFGARADPSVDPHFLYLSTNMAYSRHMFDALVDKDETSQRRPGLAVSWSVVAPMIWEFRLRPGVKFHDGSDFTAADVAFTIARVAGLPNNPNPYTNTTIIIK